MRTTFVLIAIVAFSASTAPAQSSSDVYSILLIRTGFRDGKPFIYHYDVPDAPHRTGEKT